MPLEYKGKCTQMVDFEKNAFGIQRKMYPNGGFFKKVPLEYKGKCTQIVAFSKNLPLEYKGNVPK